MSKSVKKFKTKNLLLSFLTFFLILFCIFMLYKIFSEIGNKNNKNKESKKKIVEKKQKKVGESPEIKLYGIADLKLVKNGVYEEAGAIATDKEDGDITKDIKIDNQIKIGTPGDYEVIYSVTDKDGNTTKISRKVNIFEVTEKDTDGISVFMYHYFYDDEAGETGEDNNYIAKTYFDGELRYLKENGYYFPNMKEIRKYVDGELDLPEKSVVITMDDAHVDNYTIAYPLAVKNQIPITLFAVTSWTDVSQDLQQEMIHTGYVSFQSHTHNMHQSGCSGQGHGGLFQCISYEDGIADLTASKEALGNSDSLAYPFGDYSDTTIQIMKDAGFQLGFTTENGQIHVGDDPYKLSRMRINGDISLDTFISQL